MESGIPISVRDSHPNPRMGMTMVIMTMVVIVIIIMVLATVHGNNCANPADHFKTDTYIAYDNNVFQVRGRFLRTQRDNGRMEEARSISIRTIGMWLLTEAATISMRIKEIVLPI